MYDFKKCKFIDKGVTLEKCFLFSYYFLLTILPIAARIFYQYLYRRYFGIKPLPSFKKIDRLISNFQ